jgi:hypothetical protein
MTGQQGASNWLQSEHHGAPSHLLAHYTTNSIQIFRSHQQNRAKTRWHGGC